MAILFSRNVRGGAKPSNGLPCWTEVRYYNQLRVYHGEIGVTKIVLGLSNHFCLLVKKLPNTLSTIHRKLNYPELRWCCSIAGLTDDTH